MNQATGSARADDPHAACIHHLFEAQVSRAPGNIAVVAGRYSLTYAELNARANAIADALIDAGTRCDDIVGLVTDRSPEMLACLLGVLKAGAAYIPLDPAYPAERLAFLVADSGATICLVPAGANARLPQLECRVLETAALVAQTSRGNPAPAVAGDNLAYVIYTSGSTGLPKGVTIEHRGLTNLMGFTRQQMNIVPGDRVLQFASLSFDASIWEIFAALSSGAALVLGDRDGLLPGPGLHALLRDCGVTIALLSPSVLRILPSHGLGQLRIIVAGTEKCTADIVREWAPGRRFFNAYGPTECTIYSTILEVDRIADEAPSIGRPIPRTPIYILDEALAPVSGDVSGELCIGGIGVGRGYLNRSQLTAEKFLTLALGDDGAQRIYRTGDRARWLANGEIEYLGRIDFQVKIRGFRVELGEIEAVLEQHPEVASAVVVDGSDSQGQATLFAYYIAGAGADVGAAELRAFLARKLPDYMVPAAFVEMHRWPLTANGKLDRSALPSPQTESTAVVGEGAAAGMSDHERALSAICSELLGGACLGADDDIFIAGFHSLLVAQLLWKINEDHGITLSYSEVFEACTIRALARLLDASPAVAAAARPVPGRSVDAAPLSFAQERVWFLEALDPDNRAYQFQAVFSIDGPLAITALEQSLNDMVARHEILRTSFPLMDGRPVQRVHPFEPFALAVDELAGVPSDQRLAEARRRIARRGRMRFQLERLPLIRWQLFRVHDEHYLLHHHEHHFLHDGWSYGVFLEELGALYGAYAQHAQPALPPPPIQYRDFAIWQREQVERGAYRGQLNYWARQLRDAPALLRLPSDRPRPATPSFRGGQLRFDLGTALYARLSEACAGAGVTAYMWLFAVFQLFLHRYSGETDICVGSGFANRNSPELERMLGMVINTLAIRGDFSGQPTFGEVLRRFRRTLIDAADNQDVPFERVVQHVNPRREAGQPVLFNTFFDAYNRPYPDISCAGVEFMREDGVGNDTAKFDLVVLAVPSPAPAAARSHDEHASVASLTVIWDYSADLFERASAQRMLGHFRTLLLASLDHAGQPVATLPMCEPSETQRLLAAGFRGAMSDYPRQASIPALFEARVAAAPEAMAVRCAGHELSYDALNRRANQLAHYLARAGVGAETTVGVCLPRGMHAVVALLAILKAGGVYVPLDPDYPPARLAFMRDDTAMSLLLTERALVDRFTATGSAGLICLDEIEPILTGEDAANPAARASGDSLAYVMYTSGSTGTPKGVCVLHRGVVRLVRAGNYVTLGPHDSVAQIAPLTFDASTFEIWGSLLHGACLEILPINRPSLEELGGFLQARGITTAWLTAGVFHQMVENKLDCLSGLRQLLAGGDVLAPASVRKYLQSLDGERRLINGYGPTENTTFTCCHVMHAASEITNSVPIGRPLDNTTVYILDESLQPVPVGVPGQLYIGGDGLARGYLHRDALNQEKFIADPFAGAAGGRLYASGDFCRWLADGAIEFVGRRDHQAKIRGYRVEPGEVEAVLAAHPDVDAATVVVAGVAGGERRLVAYFAPAAGCAPQPDAVRTFMQERLPAYMVPVAFQAIDALPLTASGKVDRRALPDLSPARHGATADSAPESAMERRLARLWQDILGVERVGVHENFFELGGHSLLATVVSNRLYSELGVVVPLSALFSNPTVAALAHEVAAIEAAMPAPFGPAPASGELEESGEI